MPRRPQIHRADEADTAIFYSISNCQDGLRGISFGNFLIKQVVEELRAELPSLRQFSTLSPVPGFRRWLEAKFSAEKPPEITVSAEDRQTLLAAAEMPDDSAELTPALRIVLAKDSWTKTAPLAQALRPVLLHLCAEYLTAAPNGSSRPDPVAKFHLGNGARLERINWMGNPGKRGLQDPTA